MKPRATSSSRQAEYAGAIENKTSSAAEIRRVVLMNTLREPGSREDLFGFEKIRDIVGGRISY